MLAKFYRLKVGNAARVATGVIACCHRNDGMFSRGKRFCRLFSHASGRASAGQYQTSAVAGVAAALSTTRASILK